MCVVPIETIINTTSPDMAALFFETAFDNSNVVRAMEALVALAILGNSKGQYCLNRIVLTVIKVIVMTFTASRVKSEIAKEGILPWSLFFATGRTTPVSWLQNRFRRGNKATKVESESLIGESASPLEQSPTPALGLQWLSSLFLIGVTSRLSVNVQYQILIDLYSYVMVVLVAFCTVSGLLYVKYIRRGWVGGFTPWGGPIAAIFSW
jgi:hypothetical protein